MNIEAEIEAEMAGQQMAHVTIGPIIMTYNPQLGHARAWYSGTVSGKRADVSTLKAALLGLETNSGPYWDDNDDMVSPEVLGQIKSVLKDKIENFIPLKRM